MLTEAFENSLSAGLDLHKRNVVSGIKDQMGEVVYGRRLPAGLPKILEALSPYQA